MRRWSGRRRCKTGDAIDKDIAYLKSQIAPEEPLQEKMHMYEDLFRQLQTQLEKGIPETQADRNRIFNIVFNGQKESSDSGPFVSQNECHAGPTAANAAQSDDTLPFVDTQGFGFANAGKGLGPVNASRAQPSPYSDGGHPTKAGKGGRGAEAYGPDGASAAGHSAGRGITEAESQKVKH